MAEVMNDFKRWADGYKIGAHLSKDLATHLDEYHQFFTFPDDTKTWKELQTWIVRGFFTGTPLVLHEFVPRTWKHPLYLDIDCNKGPHVRIENPFGYRGILCVPRSLISHNTIRVRVVACFYTLAVVFSVCRSLPYRVESGWRFVSGY